MLQLAETGKQLRLEVASGDSFLLSSAAFCTCQKEWRVWLKLT